MIVQGHDDDDGGGGAYDSYRLLSINGSDVPIQGDIPLEKDINASGSGGQRSKDQDPYNLQWTMGHVGGHGRRMYGRLWLASCL